jgi:hypothetical protein
MVHPFDQISGYRCDHFYVFWSACRLRNEWGGGAAGRIDGVPLTEHCCVKYLKCTEVILTQRARVKVVSELITSRPLSLSVSISCLIVSSDCYQYI